MPTPTYAALTDAEKRQVRMYGVTEAGMREAFASWHMMLAASLMSDAQEQIEHGSYEDARQTLNRAKWALFTLTA
jgi:hypothetical protein